MCLHSFADMNVDVGNYYSTLWGSSEEVALDMLNDLPNVIADAQTLHAPFFSSSLPDWLQDSLVNSLSHIRSAWWTAKGEWRQWEAYDCVNVDRSPWPCLPRASVCARSCAASALFPAYISLSVR